MSHSADTQRQQAAGTPQRHRVGPLRVCMHVDTPIREDPRVMRDALALAEAGAHVTIVDIADAPTSPRRETRDGICFEHVVMPEWYIPTRFKPFFLVKLVWMFLRCFSRLLRIPADIYHAHDQIPLAASYVVAKLRRKPLIFDAHEFPLVDQAITRWRFLHACATRCFRGLLKGCAAVISVSPHIVEEIAQRYGARKTALVRNIPDYRVPEQSDLLRSWLHLPQGTRIALYQGMLLPDRALETLIAAAKHLDANHVIVLMGKGPLQPYLEALIQQEGVGERVKLVPYVPHADLLQWTASADLGLCIFAPDYSVSVRYVLPNKFFEYLMAGLPVLTTKLDAIVELVQRYAVGAVVPALDPHTVGRAISAVLADEEGRERMRKNALAAAATDLRWDVEKQRLLDLYEAVLGEPHVAGVPVPGKSIGKDEKPLSVCLHSLRPLLTDGRAVRTATTLAQAGYRVTVIDVEHGRNRRRKEHLNDLRGRNVFLAPGTIIGDIVVQHILLPERLTRYYHPGNDVAWLLFKCWRMVRGLFKVVRTPADIYHASDITALPACYIAARLHKKPLIFEPYEIPLVQPQVTRKQRLHAVSVRMLRWIMPQCSAVIAASPLYAPELQRRYAAPLPVVIRNIPHFQTLESSDRLQCYLALAPQTRIVLYQGTLQPNRSLDVLIRAARYVAPKTIIVLMGEGESRAALEALTRQEQVEDRVKIIPAVPYEELLAWTASADIGLNVLSPDFSPSIKLTLPNKLFEYMMAGVPVLTSQLDAVVELVTTYKVGCVVHSLDPREVAGAINGMLADRDGLAQMRQHALEACRNELNWERESAKLVTLYHDVLAATTHAAT